MTEPKKFISLNLREKRMKENCKCKTEDTTKECGCGKKKEESPEIGHFNAIFNRMAHLKF
jgi:hypothetical protein